MKQAVVITGKNYGFVTFSTSAPVKHLLDMKEEVEVAGSKVILRQVIIGRSETTNLLFSDDAISGETTISKGGGLEQHWRNVEKEVLGHKVERAGLV